jgi:hypothetical protein
LINRDGSDHVTTNHYVLPADKVRFVGEGVAMVVGETLAVRVAGDPAIAIFGVPRRPFHRWHHDTLSAPPDPSRSGPPPARKLSFSLQLSDPDTYEGGDFQIRGEDGHVDEALWRTMRQKGSFLIFPGVIPHRVTTVTAGERRSLVGWVLGPPSEVDIQFTIKDGEGIV